MHSRALAIQEAIKRKPRKTSAEEILDIEKFGCLTFNKKAIRKHLSKEVAGHLIGVMEGRGRLDLAHANAIAKGMQEWAIGQGATHYTHWFQPMTSLAAEKHDAFLDFKDSDSFIHTFSGKALMRGEPDASSFPSGGLRTTNEARGYSSWDPLTPAFIWKSGGSAILCLPSFFYSWKGEALDLKIPLARSDEKINRAALRLTQMCGIDATSIYSTLGCEQEYFLVDRALYQLRTDLVLTGRTVFGAAPSKGQELEDHYFGTLSERVLAFMVELETAAYELGIPLKTRHSEVAPHQFEAAPIFEKASVAVDHNLVLMELMRQIARRHDLVCLLHEKPFAGINGSGKHNNWSLSTNTGINLLDPTDHPAGSLSFIILLAAVLDAVHAHAALLRAAIASPNNDHRLGGHEAPPVIISVYLGEILDKIVDEIEQGKSGKVASAFKMDLKIPAIPELPKDSTDRNRTSPFAFTGNKFEFRAVGSSANCGFPVTVLNVIVAESLNKILDEIESANGKKITIENALPVIRKHLKASKAIRFLGNNYSSEWVKEAKRRKLPMIEKAYDAYAILEKGETEKVFANVLSRDELHSRYEVLAEHYAKVLNIETRVMHELFQTQILPAAMKHQKKIAESLEALSECRIKPSSVQLQLLKDLSSQIDRAIRLNTDLENGRQKALGHEGKKRAEAFCHRVTPLCREARWAVDELELMVEDRLWPMPKYRELLFVL
jgi:glutamine synthetase